MAGRVAVSGRIRKNWTPSLISDAGVTMPLWLKADTGITLTSGRVTGWTDQSGTGNSAIQDGAAGTRPTNVTDSTLAGLSVVHFDTTAVFKSAPTGFPVSAQPFKFFYVISLPTINASRMYLNNVSTVEFGIFAEGVTGEMGIYCNAFKFSGIILRANTPYIIEVSYDGTNMIPTVNGVSGTTATGMTLGASATQYTMGGLSSSGSGNLVSNMAECLFLKGTVPAATVTNVRNYLNAKYRVY